MTNETSVSSIQSTGHDLANWMVDQLVQMKPGEQMTSDDVVAKIASTGSLSLNDQVRVASAAGNICLNLATAAGSPSSEASDTSSPDAVAKIDHFLVAEILISTAEDNLRNLADAELDSRHHAGISISDFEYDRESEVEDVDEK